MFTFSGIGRTPLSRRSYNRLSGEGGSQILLREIIDNVLVELDLTFKKCICSKI